ncbi:hypothetical protein Bca4012_020304 [Brassica carinata]
MTRSSGLAQKVIWLCRLSLSVQLATRRPEWKMVIPVSSKDGIHSSPKSVVFLVLSLTGSDTRMLNKSGSSYSGRKRTKTTTVSFAREGAGNAGKTG